MDRSLYRRDPGPTPARQADGVTLRPLTPDDDTALGTLMERAYAGTIDDDLGDNNDGAVEIAAWRQRAIADASFVAVGEDNQPLAASLVSPGRDGTAMIAYVITDPQCKGRGLGTAVVAASLQALPGAVVLAGVTDGNTPSERLLTSLGFVRTGPVT
ncbi:GNAT family N-acetyltransferase [Kutzneria sp. NPDC052558]|uniref:GNAT family N-acetyltransferase n=1 Tax=Kutzneria sp. NPDC052558 TaxID=3364121 RepID=UPI0037CAF86F